MSKNIDEIVDSILPDDCEYRKTHEYCPHTEHSCTCKPEPKCEHDLGDCWQSEKDGGCAKSFLKDCPFCKPVEPSWESIDKKEADRVDRAILYALPVEPSVEEIADEVMKKIAFEIGRSTKGTNQNRIARASIIEALRKERNRK